MLTATADTSQKTEAPAAQQVTPTKEAATTAVLASQAEPKVAEQATKPAETAGKEAAGTEGKESVPEKYEFKAANGEGYDAEAIKDFSELSKGLGLSQKAAQDALGKAEQVVMSHQSKAYAKAVEKWADETRADKDIGGDKLTETLSVASKAVKEFAPPEVQKMLEPVEKGGLGWGNNKAVIAMFHAIGKRISADKLVAGKEAPASEQSAAKIMFPTMN